MSVRYVYDGAPVVDGLLGTPLSAREVEVLQLVAAGYSNGEVGHQLGLSASTIKAHLARIGRRLGSGDRAHLVALAMRTEIIR